MKKLIALKNRIVCCGMNLVNRTKNEMVQSDAGEGYIDTMVKVIIAIVIGGLLLAFFTSVINTNIIPTVTTKITTMFGG